MLLDIDGIKYSIQLDARLSKITFIFIKNEVVHFKVPAHTPQSELIAFLRNYKNYISNDEKAKSVSTTEEITITLFDKPHYMIRQPALTTPYRKDQNIYLPMRYKLSATPIERLKKLILFQEINKIVGFWEEKLNCIVGDIKVRKLKTNLYSICLEKNELTFSSLLIHKSIKILHFLVAKALFSIIEVSTEYEIQLLDKYVEDWKYSLKIIEYEQQ